MKNGEGKKLSAAQILTIGFFLLILLGTALLSMPFSSANGQWTSPIDTFFTSASAVCVCGLVVLDTGTYFSLAGKCIILVLIQIGGLGFMTMATMLFVMLGQRMGLRERYVLKEAISGDSFSAKRLSLTILAISLSIEVCGAALLSIRFIPIYGVRRGIFFSLFHSVSAFCNAGFDLFGGFRSLEGYVVDPLVNLVLIALIVLGGLGFAVMMDMTKSTFRRRSMLFHTKITLIATGALLGSAFLVFLLTEWNSAAMQGLTFGQKIIACMFQATTLRTAGFASLPQSSFGPIAYIVSLLYMFIGASSGSTGGGVKTGTVAVLALQIRAIISGRDRATVMHRSIPQGTVQRSVAIIVVSFGIVFTGTILLCLIEGAAFSLHDIAFEIVSAFSTTGLSEGITPNLSAASRIIVALIMFMGRVGPLTLVLAFSDRRDNTNASGAVKYPEGRIMVG